MDKTNKTFVKFAVKNGWKQSANAEIDIVYYGNMGFLITKENQIKPVFVINDAYFELLPGKVFMYGEYAREIVKAIKK